MPAAYPEDSFDNMKTFAAQHGFRFPYVVDESQDVARAYDAVCTPDFFGFDRDLTLAYRGRLDASRPLGRPDGEARAVRRDGAGRAHRPRAGGAACRRSAARSSGAQTDDDRRSTPSGMRAARRALRPAARPSARGRFRRASPSWTSASAAISACALRGGAMMSRAPRTTSAGQRTAAAAARPLRIPMTGEEVSRQHAVAAALQQPHRVAESSTCPGTWLPPS